MRNALYLLICVGMLTSSCTRKLNLNYAGSYRHPASNNVAEGIAVPPPGDQITPRDVAPDMLEASIQDEFLHDNPLPAARMPSYRDVSNLQQIPAGLEKQESKPAQKHGRPLQFQQPEKKFNAADRKSAHRSRNDDDTVLLAILAILLPPLAVYLYEDAITTNFWISILLTLLFWIPGVIFALIIIL